MRYLTFFLSILVASASPGSSATAHRPVFPLMAWDYAESPAMLQSMGECGITCVAFVRPSLLDACSQYGLQAIVFDESVAGQDWSKPFDGDKARAALQPLIASTVRHPAVMGYHIKDEPKAADFPELAKAVAAVKELAPGKWPYINLFPGKGETYDKYLDDFVAICHPAALSDDRYSLIREHEIAANFWSTVAQVRAVALKHELPFWTIVLTSTHWGYREITEADLRLQVWGSLAYGVSGLGYYKFYSRELPILDAADLGNFRNGPLDQFGERTPMWSWMRNVNRQVQNLAPVYLKLRSDDVYHLTASMPDRNHGPTEKALVKAMPPGDFVIGDFTHEDGSRYVLIVNKSLTTSVACIPEFSVTPKQVSVVSPITGETKPFKYPKYYYLAPGQGALLKVER